MLYGLKKNVFLQVDYKQNYTMLKSLVNSAIRNREQATGPDIGRGMPLTHQLKEINNNNK